MVKWSEEYEDERTRAKRKMLNSLVLWGGIGFGTIVVLISLFNSGIIPLSDERQQPRDYYYKSIQSPLNLNNTVNLAIDLRGDIIGAQSPIRADVTLFINAGDVLKPVPNGTLHDMETGQPLPPYTQILFNGTSCQEPSSIFPQTIECWTNLRLNDNSPELSTYNGTLRLYYSHGGTFAVALAAPTGNKITTVFLNEEFILIEPVQATAELLRAQAAYEQWKATIIIAGIAALFTVLTMYIRLYWYFDQRFRYK